MTAQLEGRTVTVKVWLGQIVAIVDGKRVRVQINGKGEARRIAA